MKLKCHHLWHCWRGGATSSSSSSSSSTQFVDWPDRSGFVSCILLSPWLTNLTDFCEKKHYDLDTWVISFWMSNLRISYWKFDDVLVSVCDTHRKREVNANNSKSCLHAPHLQRLKSPYKVQWYKIITIFQSQDLGSSLHYIHSMMPCD
jgi:hypothetical protein